MTLEPRSAAEVKVSFGTRDGTAVAGEDYRSATGELRFAPGVTRQVIEVSTLSDAALEPEETFRVRLRHPVGATVEDATGIATITDDTSARVDHVRRTLLPEAGRVLAFNSFRCRVDRMFSGLAPVASLPSERPLTGHGPSSTPWDAGGFDGPAREQMLHNWSFFLPNEDGEGRVEDPSVWGCGNYVNVHGGGEDGTDDWDGMVANVELGTDVRLGPRAMAGVSISRSRASFDYSGGIGNAGADGELALEIFGIHPYFGWSVSPNLDLWGTFGRAWGDIETVEDLAGGRMSSDATLDVGALGVIGRLPAWRETALALKGEFAVAGLDVAGAGSEISAAKANMHRLRLSTEATHDYPLASGSLLVYSGEIALLLDGGDGATGSGMEIGSGVRYRDPVTGWTTETHTRWLALRGDTPLREWGIGALVRLDPGAFGRGPSASLARSWGGAGDRAPQPWSFGTTETFRRGASEGSLDAELAWGVAAPGGRGVLTPFVAMSLDGGDARVYRLGGRLASRRSGAVVLEFERRERPDLEAVHGFLLHARIRF